MQARRFRAANVAEAYEQVRQELGPNAVILETRQTVEPALLGLRKKEFVEVLAAPPDPQPAASSGVPDRPSLDQQAELHDELRRSAERIATQSEPASPAASPQATGGDSSFGRALGAYAESAYARDGVQDDAGDEAAYASSSPMTAAPAFAGDPTTLTGNVPVTDSAVTDRAVTDSAITESAPRVAPTPDPLGARSALEDAVELSTPLPTSPSPSLSPDPALPAVESRPDEAVVSTPFDEQVMHRLVSDVSELRTLIEGMALERVQDDLVTAPAALRAFRDRLEDQELGPALLRPVLERIRDSITGQPTVDAIRTLLTRRIAGQLPAPFKPDLTRRPAVLLLVGPAGAGKTTAAVRLALDLQRRNIRVVVAGTDVDRVGAPQQLQAYGQATGLPVHLCYTPGDLQALLDGGTADVVIVDSAGHDGRKRDRMAELSAFRSVLPYASVLLTLPATAKRADLTRLIHAFSPLGPEGLIFTRCDETATFGALLTVSVESGLGVAYTTHADGIDGAIEAGDNHALAGAVLRGRWTTADGQGQAG